MLDTVLNLGLNDRSVEGLAGRTGNPRFAWDAYRRFVQMFANVCRGIPVRAPGGGDRRAQGRGGRARDTELCEADLRALVVTSRRSTRRKRARRSPDDPAEQLRQAIRAVFDSWLGTRAVTYRRINHIPDAWGTACNVQQMVFGNKGDTSCSGVAFSRDEMTGAPEPSGDFLVNAQGEDVVSGVRTPRDLADMAD
jgi:pyruvate,orthophosphate dikinase